MKLRLSHNWVIVSKTWWENFSFPEQFRAFPFLRKFVLITWKRKKGFW